MPLYEYKCQNCNKKIEELQDINDKPLEKCPSCGGILKSLISLGSMVEINYNNQKEYLEKVIKKDAKEIANKIKNGDEKAAADIFGEK